MMDDPRSSAGSFRFVACHALYSILNGVRHTRLARHEQRTRLVVDERSVCRRVPLRADSTAVAAVTIPQLYCGNPPPSKHTVASHSVHSTDAAATHTRSQLSAAPSASSSRCVCGRAATSARCSTATRARLAWRRLSARFAIDVPSVVRRAQSTAATLRSHAKQNGWAHESAASTTAATTATPHAVRATPLAVASELRCCTIRLPLFGADTKRSANECAPLSRVGRRRAARFAGTPQSCNVCSAIGTRRCKPQQSARE